MAYLLGTDEAGYGPNLGPLVIAATLWRVPDDLLLGDASDDLPGNSSADIAQLDHQLDERLAGFIRRSPAAGPGRIVVADSKALYKRGSGLRWLEQGVLPALHALGRPAADWDSLWSAFSACTPDEMAAPWHEEFRLAVPVDLPLAETVDMARVWSELAERTGVELVDFRARAIFPAAFNTAVSALGNKATLLSTATLELARSLMAPLENTAIGLYCDKHGGRNRYAALLQDAFAADWVQVLRESRSASVYQLGPPERRITARFAAGGESFLPSALASMACKYLREVAMLAFNAFWQQQLPQLKPTAGYPVDAQRFYGEISSRLGELAIPRDQIWRSR
ncbi:hypothetical protein [Lignipirellula cremea]|uniref:Uncharacterized protein n=1 Tax=Lignipirellula cremea TaxID=2528010 RepID=A0A518DYI5_9BACT|nr:hypothetical protein [Lignipirellula cremea]QDU96906.1 Hypothetical protein Pla8534_47280 [Lignipirellula cremea]